MNRGLFVVLEGIDGSGSSTQRTRLYNYLNKISDSREDILSTREPWKSEEIRKRLEEDSDAYSGAKEMTSLYIENREQHSNLQIKPDLALGCHVLSDRYIISTLAYQSAQGVPLDKLMDMHRGKGLPIPDITFLLDVSTKTAIERISRRKRRLEKFETRDFLERTINNYREIAKSRNADLGQVVIVNGEGSIEETSKKIILDFDLVYSHWKNNSIGDIETIN